MDTSFLTVLELYVVLIIIFSVVENFVRKNDGLIIGITIGSFVSLGLWYTVGKKIVESDEGYTDMDI